MIPVDEALSSKGRLRILKVLTKMDKLHLSEIVKRTGLNYTTAITHLQLLEKLNLVKQKRFGRIRIYRLNDENPKVKAIRMLFEVWEQTSNKHNEQ
jgi:predicted transcriptional regulator